MRILFALSSAEYLRYYDDTIVELARRGHEVALAVNAVREGKFARFDALAAAQGNLSVAGLVPPRGDRWTRFAAGLRGTMDFVRYLHPQLADAHLLRARMKRQVLPAWLQALDGIRSMPAGAVRRILNGLAIVERAIPVARPVAEFLDRHQPDLVLVSPLIEGASEQVDLVKAAQTRGTPVAACIASWDNLTNKGDLRAAVDRVIVWNEAQKREAVELHRVPADRVAVTGAQVFDRWFDRRPGRSREEFCRAAGLPSSKPFVLFVGSSVFIARAEAEVPFVRRWIEAIRRSSDPAVRDLAVLLRPHPYSGPAWADADWSDLADVAVWPKGRYNPVDEEVRAGFFDSMYHCDAVVGINTSAMIEAAVVGRPVLSILADEFAASQEGTLHFRHLLSQNGGFLRVAPGLDEHVRQLGEVLRDPAAVRAGLARFVRAFVRPQGLDRPSTPILADAIEHTGRLQVRPATDTIGDRAARLVLTPVAALAARTRPESSRKETLRRRMRERWRKWKRRRERRREGGAQAAGRPALIAAALPVVAGTALAAAFAIVELSGRTPFAFAPPRNIAEAAGMGLSADVLRFLRQGQHPDALYELRPEIVSSRVVRATALEAAVWSRRVQLVRMLDRQGALDGGGTRAYLACLAQDIRSGEVLQYLAGSAVVACEPGATVRRIEARSDR